MSFFLLPNALATSRSSTHQADQRQVRCLFNTRLAFKPRQANNTSHYRNIKMTSQTRVFHKISTDDFYR